jgi:hypothetical protein
MNNKTELRSYNQNFSATLYIIATRMEGYIMNME